MEPRRNLFTKAVDLWGYGSAALAIAVLVGSTMWGLRLEIPGPLLIGVLIWVLSGLLMLYHTLDLLSSKLKLRLKVRMKMMTAIQTSAPSWDEHGPSYVVILCDTRLTNRTHTQMSVDFVLKMQHKKPSHMPDRVLKLEQDEYTFPFVKAYSLLGPLTIPPAGTVTGDISFGITPMILAASRGLAGLDLEGATLLIHDEVSGRTIEVDAGMYFDRELTTDISPTEV